MAIRVHLVPGLSAFRLEKPEPEGPDCFHRGTQAAASAAGTAYQAHRTICVALGEAVRRDHLTRSVATIAKAPKLEEEEVERFEIQEGQALMETARAA